MAFEVTRMVLTSNGLIDIKADCKYARLEGYVGNVRFARTDLHEYENERDITEIIFDNARYEDLNNLYMEDVKENYDYEGDIPTEYEYIYDWVYEQVESALYELKNRDGQSNIIGNLALELEGFEDSF